MTSEELKLLRKTLKISQQALADKLNISCSVIKKIETNRVKMRESLIAKIEDIKNGKNDEQGKIP